MSEDTALRRIAVARTARQFTAIFHAVAAGRLNLTAVLLLTPHLTPETADELLAAAVHRTKAEVRLLLAERFPKPDVPTLLQAITTPGACGRMTAPPVADFALQLAPERLGPLVTQDSPVGTEPLPSRARLAPLAPGRFALQVTIDEETHEALRYAQTLLGDSVRSGDLAAVLKHAAQTLVEVLEKQKFAKCARPRRQKGSPKGRHIPAEVKRTVWERDGGQCTFVSEKGKRCEAHGAVEFDHIETVARGGESTVGNLRLRCRAHNQFEAECTFSAEFMRGKREQARVRAAQAKTEARAKASAEAKANAEAKARAKAKAEAEARAKEKAGAEAEAEAQAMADAEAKAREEFAREQDVIPWLRQLKYSLAAARKGAQACAHIPDAPLEQRVKVALRALAPHCLRIPAPAASSTA